MNLKLWEFVSILLAALVMGVFWGPWLSLSRSMSTFKPEVFLAIAHRTTGNLAPVMTVLMPVAFLSIVPVLVISHQAQPRTFYFNLAGFCLFAVALLVTVLIEVPIVKQIMTWTETKLPAGWEKLRDRWGAFHIIRILASIGGLALLVIGALC